MAQKVRVTRNPGIALKIMSDVIPNEWAIDTRRPTDQRKNMHHTYVMDPDTGFCVDVIAGTDGDTPVRPVRSIGGSMADPMAAPIRTTDATGQSIYVTRDPRNRVRVRTTDDGDSPLPYYRRPARVTATRTPKSPRPAVDMDGRERDTTTATRATAADVDTFIRTVYGYTGRIDATMRRLARDAMADAAATARYTA